MARSLFGGSGADLIAAVGVGDGDYEPSTATFNVYTERACTNQHTNLQNLAAGAITQVVPDASGRVMFFGQDPYTGDYYLRNAAQPTSEPWLVRPALLTNRVQALEGGTGSFYTLPGAGIPISDLDTATENLINNAIQDTVVDVKGDIIVATGPDTVARLAVGANGSVLVADSTGAGGAVGLRWGAVPTAIPATIVDAKGDILAATGPDVIVRLAVGGTLGHVLKVNAGTATGLEWGAVPADATKANISGSIRQFADVPDTALGVGFTYVGDGAGALEPFDIGAVNDAFDPVTLRLLESRLPLYRPPVVVIDAGDPVPPDAPTNSIILRRAAGPSFQPTLLDENFLINGNNLALTISEDLPNGGRCLIVIGASGEATTPAAFTFTLSGGATATFVQGETALQAGSAQSEIWMMTPTGAITAGTTLTVNANLPATTTDQNRTHFLGALLRTPNLAAGVTAPDQIVAASGASSATLTKSATTGSTIQSDELAVAAFTFNSGIAPVDRTAAPVTPFQLISNQEAETGSSGRSLVVGYRVMNAIGVAAPSFQVTASDAQSGAWALAVATYRA